MTVTDGLAPPIAAALQKRGYDTLTPVQQAVLDPELSGRDALVSAQTGSGKTVAFGLALAPTLLDGAERLGRPGLPLALIIAPTRELALQVKREFEWLYEVAGATLASCVGGMDVRTERRALERGAHIVVGTPGRLRDHITRGALDLSDIRAIVLDEADEMLDLGFREDLEFILEAAPDDRRTLMFSATVPRAIAELAKNFQRDAVRLQASAEQKQHVDIDYSALLVTPQDRENAIVNVLRYHEARNAIVFCSTRANVNHLTARLHNRGFSVVALSGELTQNERTHALQAMRDGRARVCIATDVAARGIDLPGLELVIHADLPTNSETLLHRSGRTGRAGNKGVSALIVPVNQRRKAERLLAGARVEPNWARPPSADEVTARDEERLLNDETFTIPVSEDERYTVAALIERHGAEQVAAAFVRLYRGNRSAPEDITEVSLTGERKRREDRAFDEAPSEKRPRSEFGPSRWFSLSVGRRQNAEPRWLIPMLYRHGRIAKGGIGAIRMQPEETFVEIAIDSVEEFLVAIGPNKTIDKGIKVRPIEGVPDFNAPPKERPRRDDKFFADRKPPRRDRDGDAYRPEKKDWKERPQRSEAEARPVRRRDDDLRAADAEVWGDAPAKPHRDDRRFDGGGKTGGKNFGQRKDARGGDQGRFAKPRAGKPGKPTDRNGSPKGKGPKKPRG